MRGVDLQYFPPPSQLTVVFSASPFSFFPAAYNDALDKKPLLTKSMTSLVGWALGDFIAQVRGGGGGIEVTSWIEAARAAYLLPSIPKPPTLPFSPPEIHRKGCVRHGSFRPSLRVRFSLPRSLRSLFLQLARQENRREGTQGELKRPHALSNLSGTVQCID